MDKMFFLHFQNGIKTDAAAILGITCLKFSIESTFP